MAKPNPFAGKKAPPFGKGGGKAPPFEGSARDVEKKGAREGSKADMAMDRMQMRAAPPMPGFKRGGGVKRGR